MTAMPIRLPIAALLVGCLAIGTASAQQDDAATEGGDDLETVLPTGEPVAEAAPATGGAAQQGPQIYVREEHGDWEVRCLEAPEGQDDPCQMYQRLSDQNGNPTADVNVFDLPDGGDIAAGATVLTPLQTLLTAQVTMSIDGGQARRYPFSFCDEAGCYARLGLTSADVAAMRAGASATLIVVPAQAPDQQAQLTMSLTGFTAGYEAVTVANQ